MGEDSLMVQILNYLNSNSGAFTVVFSCVVAVSTFIYAILTWRLVSETRKMHKSQTDAKVTIGIKTRDDYINFIDFVVKNEGVGPAYNIIFDIEPVEQNKTEKSILETINGLGFIKKGIEYLSPQQEFRTFLTSMIENSEEKIETAINIKVSYTTSSGERINDKFLLDFSIFEKLIQLGTSPLTKIAKDIETIRQDIDRLSSGASRLEVIAYTKKEIEDEQEERHEERLRALKEFKEKQKNSSKS